MRVSIMFRPQGEAPERAAQVAAALEDAGHEVRQLTVEGGPGATRTETRDPEVIHAVGSAVAPAAATAARRSGAALVHEPLPGENQSSGRTVEAARTAATGSRGGTVLARNENEANRLRAELSLPYIPPVVGELGGVGREAGRRTLLAVYDRLPHMHPELPDESEGVSERARRWLDELGEPVRRGGLRHPGALVAYLRGRRARARGRFPAAIETLTRASQRNPDDPLYDLYLAKALRESGDTERALERLEALVAETDEPELIGEAGVELTRMGRRDRAAALARRLADAVGDDHAPTESWAEAARVRAALGDLESARRLALRAAAGARDGSAAQRTAARALENSGEPTRALELARAAGAKGQERRLAGLLRELEPGWTPELETVAGDGRGDGSLVMVLLEASLPQTPSGYAYRSRDLLAALRAGGFDPLVATRLGFPASRGLRDWSPVESVDDVVHHRFNVPGMLQYSGVPLDARVEENAERALDLVRRTRPAAIIAGTPDLNGVVALALRSATGVPVVYDVRGFPEMSWAARSGGSDTELYGLRRAAETACASAADAVITLSETMKQELAGRGVDPDRIFVVPQIVDADRFAPRPRSAKLVRSYGLDGKFVVGIVSSLTDYEGIDDLLRAVARARAERPEIAVLVVGDGAYRPTLEELTAELGIEDAVVFTGRLDQELVPDHYALLDMFAIPRRNLEVCRAVTPLKPFEALSMEIPVLANDLPALAEIVSSSGGGRTVSPDSDEALAQAILDLGSDPSARQELGRSGRRHVLAHNTPERASDAIRIAIGGLVGKNRKAR
jgi:glycosyltransferase involved in cell wall biosynthesis/Flp pilus assembly protein TadD